MRTLMKKRSWLPKVAVEEHVEVDESVLTVELDTPLSRVDEASNHLTAIVNDGVELESDAIANEMSKITKIPFGADTGKKDDGSILDDMPTMKKFVAKGDVKLIRQSFFMRMNDKHMDVAKLRELLKYLEKNVPGLFEELKVDAYSQEIEQDKSKWDRRMYHTMELYAVNNFAKLRLNNMLDILEHIR